jgi:hypothetical protein
MKRISEFFWNKRVVIMLVLGVLNILNGVLTLLVGDLVVGLGILGLGVFLCYETKNL